MGAGGAAQLRAGVADVVRRQEATGIDVVDDGEFGKTMWTQYVIDRLDGVGSRDPSAASEPRMKGRDREQFPDFYAWADANATLFGYMEDAYFFSPLARQPVVTGPVRYRPEAVERDIANLKAALADQPDRDAFLPVVAPASIEVGLADEHYGNRDDLMRALADALAQEYRAIVDAGFLLQVDDAWVPASWDRNPEYDLESYRRYAADSIEVLNHALDGLPADRIRYHLCWGSWHGPHRNDVPLADIADIMLRVNAGAYLIEAANSRHEHEYHLWEDVKLPDGQDPHPRRGDARDQRDRAPGAGGRADHPLRRPARGREHHRRGGLRVRLADPPRARLGEARRRWWRAPPSRPPASDRA